MSAGKLILWLGLILSTATMSVQFVVTLGDQMTDGETVFGAIIYFFGLLTNLGNIWLILIYAAMLSGWRSALLTHRNAHASAVALIVLIALFYHFILRPTFTPPEGLDFYLDLSKHYLTPALYILWWLVAGRTGKLSLKHLPIIALPGLIYPVYVFARGALINDYPYSVIDVTSVGYPSALTYAAAVIVGFTILCLITILIDKAIARLQSAQPKKTS